MSDSSRSRDVHWYVLRTKPHRETVVWEQARVQGIESFYPRLPVRPTNPRARATKPYFPGYIFVRADLDEIGPSVFQYMPYTAGLVCFGGEPARVPDALIHGIRRRVDELAEQEQFPLDNPRRDDRVWITAGPFAGHSAMFDMRRSSGDRVRLLLQMLSGRSVPIELDSALIEYSQRI